MKSLFATMYVSVAFVCTCPIQASVETLGPKGINSVATGLNGMNSAIGQVEPGRPGKPGYDTEANCCNDDVDPFEVYTRVGEAGPNIGLSEHALWVASVMISKQMDAATPNQSPPLGVAPQTLLESAAFSTDQTLFDLQEDAAIAAQTITPLSFATNMSFSVPQDGTFQFDGNSTLTSFVDWSTVSHEVLYVVAGNEIGKSGVPSDNFNGITVAASARAEDGYFRRVSGLNVYDEAVDAVGDRTSTLILAPGDMIDVAGPNGTQPTRIMSSGTSFAAPHVTGTLALLQQQANTTNGNRPLTKKAVILNSADKIKDIIGMERTVGDNAWFSSDAHTDPAIPVDREMGVGHLNANRAVQQHGAGEFSPGFVPNIGWDYGTENDPFVPTTYTLTLSAGDYVSATLVWDREVFLNSPFLDYSRGDTFTDDGFENLDLYLVPFGLGVEFAVASSTSTAWNLEHFFASVPSDGNYQIWVDLNGSDFTLVNYALAWWAGSDDRPAPGDFNSDGSVDAADYVVWRRTDGSPAGYNEWRANFGNSSGSGGFESVPEPSGFVLFTVATVLFACRRVGRT